MKKKTMAFVMSLLMIVALVGVGFATWVITADTNEKVEGNITVDAVVDTRIGIKAEWVTEKGLTEGAKTSVVFGAPKTTTGWLTNDSTEKENLKMYLKLTITHLYQKVDKTEYKLDNADGIKFSLTAGSEKYNTAASKNYVGALPEIKALYLCVNNGDSKLFLSTDKSDTEYNVGTDVEVKDGGATVIIPVQFKWGSAFNNGNPYDFYSGLNIDDEASPADPSYANEKNGDRAYRVLNDLKALNSETFNIVITAKSTSNTVLA